MISGRHTLGSIDDELRRERKAVDELDRRMAAGSARLLEVGKAQAEAYRELARLRVASLASGPLSSDLDATERRVATLLERRAAAQEELASTIANAEAERERVEADRARQADAVEEAAARVDATEAKTQARLAADAGYQAQLEATREADRVAMHASEKATRSEEELDDKGRAYRNDPLFMYLWRRRYGTPDYRAAPLFRWLDGKVARHAGFLDARADYARLLDIPKRLREHADAVRAAADAEFGALQELDRSAREADGIPALEGAEAQETARLAELDQRLEKLATDYQALLDRRQRFAAGEDDDSREAVEVLASGLRREDLRSLHEEATRTPFPEDDVVIGRLQDLREEQAKLETAAEELGAAVQQRRDRLTGLESLRAEYKRRQYDQPGHGFEDGTLVATVLANVIGGMLNRDALWRVLEQQRRFRPPAAKPTFGSGGFGRGSPWGGGKAPRVGGFGGGGFRTGGKFGGGGGFRTGGKF